MTNSTELDREPSICMTLQFLTTSGPVVTLNFDLFTSIDLHSWALSASAGKL